MATDTEAVRDILKIDLSKSIRDCEPWNRKNILRASLSNQLGLILTGEQCK